MDKKCSNCKYFEERTHFCRLNPPQPVIFLAEYQGHNYKTSSKFPVITNPNLDYCSNHDVKGDLILE